MRLTLVLGGARSGKTRFGLGEARRLGGDRVSYWATAPAAGADPEMIRRIERHRRERPPAWQTVEEERNPASALESARYRVVVLDCLTVLLSNHVCTAASEEEAHRRGRQVVRDVLDAARPRQGELIVVSNEVGQGVVPAHPLGRWFRDVQGRSNQELAAEADRVVLVVAGLTSWLKEDDVGGASATPA